MKSKSYTELTKKIQLQTKVEELQSQTWTKIKNPLFIVLFSVLLGNLYYSYIFIPPFNQDYINSKEKFEITKKENTIALKKIKEYSKKSQQYVNYQKTYTSKKEAYNNLKKIIEGQKVFGFDSLHFFWERFGKNTTAFLFSLWVLFITIKNVDKLNQWIYYGRLIIICTFMSTTFFTYFWIFQAFQDFNKLVYYLLTFISTYFVFIATYIIIRITKNKEEKLQANLLEVARFTFKNTKPEKRDEMLEMIKKIAN